jgi:hypothetical protein
MSGHTVTGRTLSGHVATLAGACTGLAMTARPARVAPTGEKHTPAETGDLADSPASHAA